MFVEYYLTVAEISSHENTYLFEYKTNFLRENSSFFSYFNNIAYKSLDAPINIWLVT